MFVEKIRHIFSNYKPTNREANLVSQFTESTDKLPSDQGRRVLQLRLGLVGKRPLSPTEITELIGGLTLNQVREIEKASFQTVVGSDQLWGDTLRRKISDFFASYGDLLLTEDLPKFDPWFAGFSQEFSGWKVFLKYFSSDLCAMKINDVVVIMKASKVNFFNDLVGQLQSNRRQGWKDEQFFETLQSNPEVDFPITDYFVSTLSRLAKDYAPTIRAMVRRYLESATGEVYMEDFFSFARENGFKVEEKRYQTIESAIVENCACVSRKPTRFATIDTIVKDPLRIQEFCNGFYKYWLASFAVEREFHGDEVRDWGETNGFAEEIRSSSRRANALLSFDNGQRFGSFKLRVWLTEYWGEEKPIQTYKLVENTLKEAGRPMTVQEVEKTLYPIRSVGANFKICERKGILKCGPNTWKYHEED